MTLKKNPLHVVENEPKKPTFPAWLRRSLPKGGQLYKTGSIVKKYQINTVCEEAKCPNRFSCYAKKTATFLALGKSCTRSCAFCDIDFTKTPKALEKDEPLRIALSAKELGLKHIVITMVARDDLDDGGADQLVQIMRKVREHNPKATLEILTSDFSGNADALKTVLNEKPEIFNHNVETVERLSPKIRHKASYKRSLDLLKKASHMYKAKYIKSGLMLGLGESPEEVLKTMRDMKEVGVTVVTIGQYLQASRKKIRVKQFIPPSMFDRYEDYGKSIGLLYVYAGPFVRSSLNAKEVHALLSKKNTNFY